MQALTKYNRFLLTLLHIALGVLLLSSFITKVYSLAIVIIGVLLIIRSNNANNEAVYFSAYIVGAEVMFRMSGGMIFHELPKYSVLLFLLIGLIVEKRNHHISITYLIYILLLLIGIAFVDIPFNESLRKAIAFNLSGPVLLGVSAIYFYKRRFLLDGLVDIIFFMLLPIISMLVLLYLRTPNFEEITFGSTSNFEASGGFGPNQVATILGVGIFIITAHLFLTKRVFLFLIFDIILFTYVIFRGLITFSRGGIITAVIAIAVFTVFFVLAREDKLKIIFKYGGLVVISGIVLFIYTSNLTGGMLENRYANKNAAGVVRDDATTGRLDLFKAEIEVLLENPFFGIGVGGSKYYRAKKLNKVAASHNEMSRLLSEHGLIGILTLLILISVPTIHILKQPLWSMAFLSAFLLFWFLTINHSAMRVAFPAFIYGLSVVQIVKDKAYFELKNNIK